MGRDPSLGELLKEARKRLGWSQDALAEHLGKSRSLVASLEGGGRATVPVRRKLIEVLPEPYATQVRQLFDVDGGWDDEEGSDERSSEPVEDDMISRFMSLRRSRDVDLSGQWKAVWLTTTNGQENRNTELISVRKRWNSTWEFHNETISPENPDGGYLWVARMELYDNRHILGHYCAQDAAILAKGTLCLELQSNGRDVLGVWHGLNFDTMWAQGLVAMSRVSAANSDPHAALDRFVKSRPKMPY